MMLQSEAPEFVKSDKDWSDFAAIKESVVQNQVRTSFTRLEHPVDGICSSTCLGA